MPQAQDLVNYCETLLQQTSSMIVAGLPSGGGENDDYTIQSNTQLLLWATEGQNRLARLCLPIFDTATVTVETAGQRVLAPYSEIVSPTGRILATPTQVFLGSYRLTPGNQGYLNNPRWYPPTPSGNPTGWSSMNSLIQLSQYSAAPLTFTIPGYYLPAPLTNPAQELDPAIDDFAFRTIAFYMAWMVALKNQDNTVLAERIVPMQNEWVASVKETYARLLQNDPTTAALFPAEPVNAMQVSVVKQVMPRN